MRQVPIVVKATIDQKTFKRFARYDAFARKRIWMRPLIFALIMTVFAMIAIFSGRSESILIAVVLLVIGFGLPAVYIGTFLSQVAKKSKALKRPLLAYTVTLRPDCVDVVNHQRSDEALSIEWKKMHAACRNGDAIYLYAAPQKAFILPDSANRSEAEEIRAFIVSRMDRNKLHGF